MSADIVQARYDALEEIAGSFRRQAELNGELAKRVSRSFNALTQGGWQGKGAASFSAEMQGELFPALRRLNEALLTGQSVTLEIRAIVQQAEQEAGVPFRGTAVNGSSNGQASNALPTLQGAGGDDFSEATFLLKTAPKAAWFMLKNRFMLQGLLGGVKFIKDANGMWRLLGPQAAKQAMGLASHLTRFGPNAIQRSLDAFSPLKALTQLPTAIKNGQFGSAARQVMRNLTQVAPLSTAASFMQNFKGPAILSTLVSAGANIYEFGWGASKDVGLASRQFITSTTADVSAGLGIVAVSTAIGTAIPIPFVGTAIGFGVGVGLQYAYERWGKEAWRGVVDSAGQHIQNAASVVGREAAEFGRDVARGAQDVVNTIGEGARNVGEAIQDKWNDVTNGVGKLFRPPQVFGWP